MLFFKRKKPTVRLEILEIEKGDTVVVNMPGANRKELRDFMQALAIAREQGDHTITTDRDVKLTILKNKKS